MTQDEIKKIDKMVRSINDPFGTGYPRLEKIRQEIAIKYGISESELYRLFASWKSGHH